LTRRREPCTFSKPVADGSAAGLFFALQKTRKERCIMALIKFGGGVVQMSGSIAGTTFARNRYGNYARSRTKPINPNTAMQQVCRASVAFLTDYWSQTLTAVQRTAWNLYGSSVAMKNKLGETVFLTGFNHFIRSNAILKRSARTLVAAGPVIFELPEADPTFAFTATQTDNMGTFTYDDTAAWANEDGGWMHMFMGQPQNAQRNFFAGPWKLYAAVAGNSGVPPVSPGNASAPFAMSTGQRVWVYARITRADGRTSEKFRDDCFVTA